MCTGAQVCHSAALTSFAQRPRDTSRRTRESRKARRILETSQVRRGSNLWSTHHSPLATRHSPLTTHHSPLTTHHSPLTSHHSPPTTHHSPLTTQHSPLTTHHTSHQAALATHHAPLTTHHSPLPLTPLTRQQPIGAPQAAAAPAVGERRRCACATPPAVL